MFLTWYAQDACLVYLFGTQTSKTPKPKHTQKKQKTKLKV